MLCPFCGHLESKVVNSRQNPRGDAIRRRRECLGCAHRFTTFEMIEKTPIVVVKRDGKREAFDREKLIKGLLRACEKRPVTMEQVERIRDGRSFATRRVTAVQGDEAIFVLDASFHVAEEGYDHGAPMPADVPDPESLPDFATRWAPIMGQSEQGRAWLERPRPIDMRYVDWEPEDRRKALPPRQRVWMRANGDLPDDPVLHQCVLTYASDMSLLDTTLLPHAKWHSPDVFMASLDHAMWFHRPVRADDWWLYDQETPTATGGRGLARGLIWDRDGNLCVSVVQEGLIRQMRT